MKPEVSHGIVVLLRECPVEQRIDAKDGGTISKVHIAQLRLEVRGSIEISGSGRLVELGLYLVNIGVCLGLDGIRVKGWTWSAHDLGNLGFWFWWGVRSIPDAIDLRLQLGNLDCLGEFHLTQLEIAKLGICGRLFGPIGAGVTLLPNVGLGLEARLFHHVLRPTP